jgi:tetratricopeptide (TPR) repeat protein
VDALAPLEARPKAKQAAERALELDDTLAEAHAALGWTKLIFEWDFPGADNEFKRAIELNPNSSPAHVWYAHYLVAMGRFDESISEAKRSLELDPFSLFTMDFAEWAFYLARRYDLVLEQSRRSLELAPEFPWARYELGKVYERTSRGSEAVQEFMKAEELFGMSQDRLAELRKAYHQSGEKGYWRKILEFCQEESKHPRKFASTSGYGLGDYMQNAEVAAVQVRLGEFNAAFESLDRGYANHEFNLIYLKVNPYWDDIRSDPRFRDLVRRVGLPQ